MIAIAPEMPKVEFNIEMLGLLFAVAFPGLLSTQTYRLIMPVGAMDWKDGLLGAMFYTCLNDIVLFPFIRFLLIGSNAIVSPYQYWGALIVVFLAAPMGWPILWVYLSTKSPLKKWLIIPYRTAFDYFFSYRTTCFVIVHLKDRRMIAGWYGNTGIKGYATTFPESGDLFLSAAVRLTPSGEFGDAVPSSIGVLIRRDEYTHLELHTDRVVTTASTEPVSAQPQGE